MKILSEDVSAVRSISPKSQGNWGFFSSAKVQRGVAEYESQLERDFFLLLDHDPSVIRFQHQPVRITFEDNHGKKKYYVPNVLVEFHNGKRVLVEIKDEDTFNTKRRQFEERWTAARMFSERNGVYFKIGARKHIRTPRLANIWFTLGSSKTKPLPEHLNTLLKLISFRECSKSFLSLLRGKWLLE
ncbi:MAG: TnsA endonuclease N-terminal domain-containing protein [Candidatus Heimdallarchaeota archaeon]